MLRPAACCGLYTIVDVELLLLPAGLSAIISPLDRAEFVL